MRAIAIALVFLAAPVLAQPASQTSAREAAPPDSTSEAEAPAPETSAREAPAQRALPNYDGRPAHTSAARRALWVPRVLVSPLYFVTEFMVRRPLGALFRLTEGSNSDPLRFFVFGENGQLAVVPTLLIDFGNRPSAGLYVRWNEAGHPMHQMRFHFATWGKRWLKGRLTERWVGERFMGELRLSAERREDGRFTGIGAQARPGQLESRYRFVDLQARLRLEAYPWRESFARVEFGVRKIRFTGPGFRGPSVQERIALGQLERPPGFEGYSMYYQRVELNLNSRRRSGNSSGVELHVMGSHAFDLQRPEDRRWVSYGAHAIAHVDVGGPRVFSLAATVQGTAPIAGEVPFTELPQLGGIGPLPGYRFGALYGDTTASLVLRYSWPIWAVLNATVHIGVGNAFSGTFEDFSLGNQRLGFGVGFAAVDNIDHIFHFVIGWGTDTFERGARVRSSRVSLGASWEL